MDGTFALKERERLKLRAWEIKKPCEAEKATEGKNGGNEEISNRGPVPH